MLAGWLVGAGEGEIVWRRKEQGRSCVKLRERVGREAGAEADREGLRAGG